MLLTDCLLVDFIYCPFSERSVAILYYIYGIVEFWIDLVVVAVVFSHWLSIAPVELNENFVSKYIDVIESKY